MQQKQKPINKVNFSAPRSPKKTPLLKRLFKKPTKKQLSIALPIVVIILVGAAYGVSQLLRNEPPTLVQIEEKTVDPPPVVVPTTAPSPLTGIEVSLEEAARPVTAVMIENSIDARPQSGLAAAGVVYEAIAEGGITRFMAVYQEARPGNIGPIRSARPYYVRWAAGYQAGYLHSGGSPEAIALIRSLGVRDLDHGTYGEGIASRVSYRYAPHNVYSNFDKIDPKSSELGFTKSEFTPFARKDDTPPTVEAPATASTISFAISGPNYNTSYAYDPASNSYKRTMAGIPHTDQETGAQLQPKVVVGLVMGYRIHPNGIHSIYDNVGSGEAYIFQDGIVTIGTWKKASDTSSLELTTSSGEPLALNRGQVWITAVPSGRITYNP